MISPQARIAKFLIETGKTESPDMQNLGKYRQDFERNLRILFPTLSNRHVRRTELKDVTVDWIEPRPNPQRTIVYVHGGAFALGSPRSYRQHLVRLARICNAKVLAIDYLLAPEHPYPHATNQVYELWQALLSKKDFDPSNIVLMGDSAGANIAFSTALRLRDESLPQPACIVLLSPGLDATFEGDSYTKNKGRDPIFTIEALEFYMKIYVQNHEKKDPRISPVFADLAGLPPMLIQVGSNELMLSSSQKLHDNAKRDGVKSQLFVGEGMWHNWHLFAGFVPEAKQAMQAIGEYVASHT